MIVDAAPTSISAIKRRTRMADNTVLLEDVRIIFRNFAGEERMYNAQGKRNFTVILDEETGQKMLDDGWNVKRLKPREDDVPGDLSLKVTVSYKGRTKPRLVLITKSTNRRNVLDEDMAELMDYAEFETVDIMIRPYDWDVNGETGRSAYLKTIYGTIREDELDLKYAHYEDDRALPPGEDPNVLEGVIVDEYDDPDETEYHREINSDQRALPRGRG